MNGTLKLCWAMWIIGTLVIVASWAHAVSPVIGWLGFGLALSGTLVSSCIRKESCQHQAASVYRCSHCDSPALVASGKKSFLDKSHFWSCTSCGTALGSTRAASLTVGYLLLCLAVLADSGGSAAYVAFSGPRRDVPQPFSEEAIVGIVILLTVASIAAVGLVLVSRELFMAVPKRGT